MTLEGCSGTGIAPGLNPDELTTHASSNLAPSAKCRFCGHSKEHPDPCTCVVGREVGLDGAGGVTIREFLCWCRMNAKR